MVLLIEPYCIVHNAHAKLVPELPVICIDVYFFLGMRRTRRNGSFDIRKYVCVFSGFVYLIMYSWPLITLQTGTFWLTKRTLTEKR